MLYEVGGRLSMDYNPLADYIMEDEIIGLT
jgi:hypothetical protein